MISHSVFHWLKSVHAIFLLCAATSITLSAQTFTTLVNFDGTNGANPQYGTLVQGIDGDLYGTALNGGSGSCSGGCGTVFKISPGGTFRRLHSFDGPDGHPYNGLAQAAVGDFYGVAVGSSGLGSIFVITPGGNLTTVHNFDGSDGIAPQTLVQAHNRDLYGVTGQGGLSINCIIGGCGTVFKITPNGTLTTLYNFCPESMCPDGSDPQAGLVQSVNGDFYGATAYGGPSNNCQYGCGTVFKITPNGKLTTLHVFNRTDGGYPAAGLIETDSGDFFGTTVLGGATDNGTIFKLTAAGTLTMLHSFAMTDGAQPWAGLTQATDGDFYGTTFYGGTNGAGTIFKITPSGKLTTLHNFGSDGSFPDAGLVQHTNGDFYGTTYIGGNSTACGGGCGTVFGLSLGLGPFVTPLPTSGKVGVAIRILGTNLTGTTSVSFNGVPATSFTVNSMGSAISTTVPVGAATGKVQVVTPAGTLSSNVVFRVP